MRKRPIVTDIAWSLCRLLLTAELYKKTAELIEMPLGVTTGVRRRSHVQLSGDQDPPGT